MTSFAILSRFCDECDVIFKYKGRCVCVCLSHPERSEQCRIGPFRAKRVRWDRPPPRLAIRTSRIARASSCAHVRQPAAQLVIIIIIRQSKRYAENPRDTAVFRGQRPPGSLFRKNKKKNVFRYGLVECVCTEFQVCIFFRCDQKVLYRHINRHKYLQVTI